MSLLDRLKRLLGQGQEPARLPSFGDLNTRALAAPRQERVRTPGPVAGQEGIQATEEFELALTLIEEGSQFTLVTGQAGTGKTTFIRWLRSKFDGNVVVVAPTGLAAITAGGQTIHSFFGFPPRVITPDDIRRRKDRAVFEAMDLLVVDEISMVSCELLDAMDRFLRLNRVDGNKPFGGVPVVALGDLFQLPPVAKADDLKRILGSYDSIHFFSAKALADVAPVGVELTRPFRQRDARFLELLRCIREGEAIDGALEELNRRCLDEALDESSWMVVVPTRRRAEAINTHRLRELGARCRTYTATITGAFLSGSRGAGALSPDNAYRDLPSPYELELAVGARVLFTRNDPSGRWVNGTMGTVARLSDDFVAVTIDGEPGHAVDVTRETWKREKFVFDEEIDRIVLRELGTYSQLPLTPAWAITIHKVQGQTVDRIVVDLDGGIFAAGQTYVALSRCRTIEGLRVKHRIRTEDVRCDPAIRRFMTALRESSANRILNEPSTE